VLKPGGVPELVDDMRAEVPRELGHPRRGLRDGDRRGGEPCFAAADGRAAVHAGAEVVGEVDGQPVGGAGLRSACLPEPFADGDEVVEHRVRRDALTRECRRVRARREQ
jgi:hypothetical protein